MAAAASGEASRSIPTPTEYKYFPLDRNSTRISPEDVARVAFLENCKVYFMPDSSALTGARTPMERNINTRIGRMDYYFLHLFLALAWRRRSLTLNGRYGAYLFMSRSHLDNGWELWLFEPSKTTLERWYTTRTVDAPDAKETDDDDQPGNGAGPRASPSFARPRGAISFGKWAATDPAGMESRTFLHNLFFNASSVAKSLMLHPSRFPDWKHIYQFWWPLLESSRSQWASDTALYTGTRILETAYAGDTSVYAMPPQDDSGNPDSLFTIHNAVARQLRCAGRIPVGVSPEEYNAIVDGYVRDHYTDDHTGSYGPCLASTPVSCGPPEVVRGGQAYLIRNHHAHPARFCEFLFPNIQPAPQLNGPDVSVFASEFGHLGDDETIRKAFAQLAGLPAPTSERDLNVETWGVRVEERLAKARSSANPEAERQRVIENSMMEFASVHAPHVTANGFAAVALATFESRFLSKNPRGNFYTEYGWIPLPVTYTASDGKVAEVSDVHPIVHHASSMAMAAEILAQLASTHSEFCLLSTLSKGANRSLKAGTLYARIIMLMAPGAGKGQLIKMVSLLCLCPGTFRSLIHASSMSSITDEHRIGAIYFFEEWSAVFFDPVPEHMKTKRLIDIGLGKASSNTHCDEVNRFKNSATQRTKNTDTATVDKGKRTNVMSDSVAETAEIVCSNGEEALLPPAVIDRAFIIDGTGREDEIAGNDAIPSRDIIYAYASERVQVSDKSKIRFATNQAIVHALIWRLNVLAFRGILRKGVDTSMTFILYHMFTEELEKRGYPKTMSPRKFQKIELICSVKAMEVAVDTAQRIMLWDPARPFRNGDECALEPLLYVDVPIFVHCVELANLFNDSYRQTILCIFRKHLFGMDPDEKMPTTPDAVIAHNIRYNGLRPRLAITDRGYLYTPGDLHLKPGVSAPKTEDEVIAYNQTCGKEHHYKVAICDGTLYNLDEPGFFTKSYQRGSLQASIVAMREWVHHYMHQSATDDKTIRVLASLFRETIAVKMGTRTTYIPVMEKGQGPSDRFIFVHHSALVDPNADMTLLSLKACLPRNFRPTVVIRGKTTTQPAGNREFETILLEPGELAESDVRSSAVRGLDIATKHAAKCSVRVNEVRSLLESKDLTEIARISYEAELECAVEELKRAEESREKAREAASVKIPNPNYVPPAVREKAVACGIFVAEEAALLSDEKYVKVDHDFESKYVTDHLMAIRAIKTREEAWTHFAMPFNLRLIMKFLANVHKEADKPISVYSKELAKYLYLLEYLHALRDGGINDARILLMARRCERPEAEDEKLTALVYNQVELVKKTVRDDHSKYITESAPSSAGPDPAPAPAPDLDADYAETYDWVDDMGVDERLALARSLGIPLAHDSSNDPLESFLSRAVSHQGYQAEVLHRTRSTPSRHQQKKKKKKKKRKNKRRRHGERRNRFVDDEASDGGGSDGPEGEDRPTREDEAFVARDEEVEMATSGEVAEMQAYFIRQASRQE